MNRYRIAAIFLSILIGLGWVVLVYDKFLSQRYLERGAYYLEYAHSLPKESLLKKVLAYQDALKLLNKPSILGGRRAEASFSYAQAVLDINQNIEIAGLIDPAILEIDKLDSQSLLKRAKIYLYRAVSIHPSNGIYHQRLGLVYLQLDDRINAEVEFRKAFYCDPLNLSLLLFLSNYYLNSQDKETFSFYLDKTAKLYKQSVFGSGNELESAVKVFFKDIGRLDLLK